MAKNEKPCERNCLWVGGGTWDGDGGGMKRSHHQVYEVEETTAFDDMNEEEVFNTWTFSMQSRASCLALSIAGNRAHTAAYTEKWLRDLLPQT